MSDTIQAKMVSDALLMALWRRGNLQEVRDMTADWLHRYNHHRPHEALGRIPPVEYRVKLFPNLYCWLAQEIEGTSTGDDLGTRPGLKTP